MCLLAIFTSSFESAWIHLSTYQLVYILFKFCFSSWIWILILKDERVTVKDFLHTVGWVAHCSGNFLLLCSFLQSHCYFLDHPSFRLPGPPRASSLAVPAWLIFPRQSSRAILKPVLRWWFPHYIKGWKHLLSLTQDHVYAKNLTSRPWLQWKKLTMEVCTSQTRAHCVLRHCLLSLIYPALPTLFFKSATHVRPLPTASSEGPHLKEKNYDQGHFKATFHCGTRKKENLLQKVPSRIMNSRTYCDVTFRPSPPRQRWEK